MRLGSTSCLSAGGLWVPTHRPSSGIFDFPLSLVGDTSLKGFWRVDAAHVGGATNGSGIPQIDDRSGNGNHATQSTALSQLVYDDVDFATPAAVATTGQVMSIASALAASMPSNNFTTWAVFSMDDIVAIQGIFVVGASGGMALDVESNKYVARAQGVGTATAGTADFGEHLLVIMRDAGTIRMQLDGVEQVVTGNPNVVAPSGASKIGAITTAPAFGMNGFFFEAGAYAAVFSTSQLAALWAYVQAWHQPIP